MAEIVVHNADVVADLTNRITQMIETSALASGLSVTSNWATEIAAAIAAELEADYVPVPKSHTITRIRSLNRGST